MLSIPIVSEFNGKGVQKAIKQFKQLETTGQRVGFVLKKAGQAAAIGFAAIGAAAVTAGAAMWNFAKAAMADQKSQRQLAASIRGVTKATDAQIKATEEWITKTQLALGVSDVDLRGGLARLVRSTKDVTAAQKLLNVALDVSTATGKPLETVVNALGKAYDGNKTALGRLGVGFDKAALKSAPFAKIVETLDKRFGGTASKNANTFEGRMARLSETFGELKETLGTAILPYLDRLAQYGIDLGEIMGKEGLAGAIDYLVESLKQLIFYNANGELNAVGKSMQLATTAFNAISRAAGVIGGAGQIMLGGNISGGLNTVRQSISGTAGTINTLNPYSDPFAARAVGGALPRVTINFNGVVGDPVAVGRQVRSVLDRYERRTGGR